MNSNTQRSRKWTKGINFIEKYSRGIRDLVKIQLNWQNNSTVKSTIYPQIKIVSVARIRTKFNFHANTNMYI